MEITERLELPCAPSELYPHVDDLDRYPSWMRLVHAAERVDDPEDRPAWTVELRARVGPLARSKRLRMVRSEAVPDQLVVFERAELDGRVHARWALRAELEPTPGRQRADDATVVQRIVVDRRTARPCARGRDQTRKCLADRRRHGRDHALNRPSSRRSSTSWEAEALGHRLARQHVVDRTLGDRAPVAQQERVRHPWRYLVDMVRDEHERRRRGIGSESCERIHQLFAASDVEAGRRLVEEHHRRVVHQCARQEHALLLTGRQGAERAFARGRATPIRSRHCVARVASASS